MIIEKCKHYNGHQTACCLMIDDLAPVAISRDGSLGPHNDWGYLKDGGNSLYSYMDKWLFSKYPEIRGTIFFPLETQSQVPTDTGYKVYSSPIKDEYLTFLKKLRSRFEIAFHGLKHSWKDDQTGQTVLEYADCTQEYLELTKLRLKIFHDETGIEFTGGKFPGYKYNNVALDLLSAMGAKWWALDSGMLQRKTPDNVLRSDRVSGITSVPTNISGDCFNRYKYQAPIKTLTKRITGIHRSLDTLRFIHYLYERGLPITIQEHYQNQGTSGKRQRPNMFDDISSLDRIFGELRYLDIWHTSCGQLAQYHESLFNTTIDSISQSEFKFTYKGRWDFPLISVKVDRPRLHFKEQKRVVSGVQKGGSWIYNDLQNGSYTCSFIDV